MSILQEIGLAVRTKFEQDKLSDDKKMGEVEANFDNQTGVYLPGEYSEDISLINELRESTFSAMDKAFGKYSGSIVTEGENIKNLLSDDNIINVFAELDSKLTEEGEELNERISEYNEELSTIAAEREAYFGFDDATVNASVELIRSAWS